MRRMVRVGMLAVRGAVRWAAQMVEGAVLRKVQEVREVQGGVL